MTLQRRAFLARVEVGAAVPISLAGCLGGMAHGVVVKLDQQLASGDAEGPTDVVYDESPAAEQRIVSAVVEEGLYHVCPELPDSMRSFVDRVAEPGESYLTYRSETYGMCVKLTDLSQPPTRPQKSCCRES